MKPGDFFLGVTEFFSFLLPGAGIAYIALFWINHIHVPNDHLLWPLMNMKGVAAWSTFAVVSYTLGHLVESFGAGLDPLYDSRKTKYQDRALRHFANLIRQGFIKNDPNYKPAKGEVQYRIHSVLGRLIDTALLWRTWTNGPPTGATQEDKGAIDVEEFARKTLQLRSPTMFSEVVRLEADSKFFRSIAVVAMFALVTCVLGLGIDVYKVMMGTDKWERAAWGAAYLVFVFAGLRLAFSRYCELRLKATETAYQGLVVVENLVTHSGNDAG